MRLIDADALKQECMYIDDIPAITERDIHNAPTIDAIPVGWIRKYADTVGSRVRAEIVREMLDVWEKEQEAR